MPTPTPTLLAVLARSILAGERTIDGIVARCTETLGRPWRWLGPLAKRYLERYAGVVRPRQRDVVGFLFQDADFSRARSRHARQLSIDRWLAEPPLMQPVEAAAAWDLPAIATSGELAQWLSITPAELDWFADLKRLTLRPDCPKLRHYRYTVLTKRSGSVRLIEAPKPRLKQMQRRILTRILDPIPLHPAVHGFCKGRSIGTFVAPHTGRRIVPRMDLQDFFPSFPAARIQAFFRTLGYPEAVANLLGGICTNATPRDIWTGYALDIHPSQLKQASAFYALAHLPQGAPSSPALANLCTYRADCRLRPHHRRGVYALRR